MSSLLLAEVLCRSYIVAGQSVTFACADDEAAAKVTRLVAGWHFTPSLGEPASAFTVHVSSDAAPPMPQGPADFAVHHGECFSDGDSWALSTGDSWVRVHPLAARRVDVWIGEETARSSTAFARLLFYATQAALRQCGLYELHTAAVVPPSGAGGTLFVGASGSGKTTLAMRLTAAGWWNVADDLVLLREDSAATEAFAFRRVFAATETTLEACPTPGIEEATRQPSELEPSKRRLDPEVLFPGRFAPSCTPRTLVFPAITGQARTETRPMMAPDALTRLLKMCPWASYDTAVARPHLSALARLARQCDSYELLAGTDLLYDPQAAPRLFASLSGGAQ
ncbi:MAG TPA: hypothetical protein VFP80_14010 [Thermoanaerobaculia bacterium]|nr:hypothetical protein [Thermoanaerobaculia bacterium]